MSRKIIESEIDAAALAWRVSGWLVECIAQAQAPVRIVLSGNDRPMPVGGDAQEATIQFDLMLRASDVPDRLELAVRCSILSSLVSAMSAIMLRSFTATLRRQRKLFGELYAGL
jgi:hypothetical protein